MVKIDFTKEALNSKVGDIERPPLLPQGSYICSVAKAPTFRETGENDMYHVISYTLNVLSAMDDVDPDAIAEFGDITKQQIRHDFLFNTEDQALFDRTKYNVRRFLEEHLQIEGAEKMGMKQALQESVNHQCIVEVGWRPNPDNPDEFFLNIRRTAPLE